MKTLSGIYVLIIQVNEDVRLDVGALGDKKFARGLYAYVGSAQTNLVQRIKRHLIKKKKNFWHIDYLLSYPTVKIIKVFYKEATKTEECKTANNIGERSKPIADFGCSDCNCKSHLFHIKNVEYIEKAMKVFSLET